MRRIRLYTVFVAAAAFMQLPAQNPHVSYFMENMPTRHELNPALTPEFGYVAIPVLSGLHMGLNSNVGLNDFLFSRNGELVTGLNSQISAADFLGGLKDKNYMEMNLKLNVLSFGFKKWGGYNTFSVNVRSNTGVNLPYELFEFAKVGQVDGAPTSYDINGIRISSTNFVELAIGHSRQITDRLRAGAKFKYLAGVAKADMEVEQMNVYMSEDKWSVSDRGQMFTTGFADIRYKENGEIDDFDFGEIGVAGNGIAFDLGASYELLDNLTLSASLTDIGFLAWKGSNAVIDPSEFEFDGFHHLGAEDDPTTGESALDKETDQLEEDLKELVRFRNEADATKQQSLTTTLNVGGEYSILNDKISFGLLSSTRFGGPKTWTELMASANFRPASWFNATVSGSTSNLGHALGAALNFSPRGFNFFLGADYIPLKYAKQGVPLSTAKVNLTFGMIITFNHN